MNLNKQLLVAFIIIAVLFALPNLQNPDISEEIVSSVNVLVIKDTENLFASERNQTNIENLFDRVNGVWSQANIRFQLNSINFVDIETSKMKDIWDIPKELISLQNFDGESINVIFIKNMSYNGVSFPEVNSVFMPDRTSNREQVALAHELGHILGLEHRPDEDYLMFSVCNGTKISFHEIRTARSR